MSTGLAPDQHRISDEEIQRAKRRFDIFTAEIALRRQGRELVGLCPMHNEKSPSFYVVPDKGWAHCFGCGWHGDVVDFVMQTRRLTFAGAVREINGEHGRPPKGDSRPLFKAPESRRDTLADVERILRESRPLEPGTAAYLYLQTRGLISKYNRAPWEAAVGALRAHPALYCHENKQELPALVAPITSSHGVTALQRIWVSDRVEYVNGHGPKDSRASLQVRKKTWGEMLDGAVRMGAPRGRLGLAEGVETAIAAAVLNRSMPVWATCGASRLGSVAIPEGVDWIRIYGDNGDAGLEHAHRAAHAYFQRGYKVEICFPEPRYGDWADKAFAEVAL